MSKHPPPVPFPVQTGATTVGPQVVRSFTPSVSLEEKTLAGVIDDGGRRLRVFRQSSTCHDHLSCEFYSRQGGRWVRRPREAPVKFIPPEEFSGEQTEVDGVSVWSLAPLDAAQVEALRPLLRPRR